jgi:serine/threonine protein kinase
MPRPRLLGEGSYGCVYKPQLQCDVPGKKVSKNLVGKIFVSNHAFEEEYDTQMNIVNKLDPKGEFTLPFHDRCAVKAEANRESLSQCKLTKQRPAPSYNQLIYENGGTSLHDFMKKRGNTPEFIRILENMRPLFVGIQRIQERGKVHQDIKPDNIMKRGEKIFLIDFGLLNSKDGVFTKDNAYVLEYDYPYYPPEFKLFGLKHERTKFILSARKNYKYLDSSAVQVLEGILGNGLFTGLDRVYDERKTDPKLFNPDKVDIYSLGMSIFEMYIWSGLYKTKNKRYRHIRFLVEDLLRNMLQLNPSNRPDIIQLINQFDDMFQRLRRL